MAELLLTDLIDIDLLQKIQDEFSKYTGMAALTTDADGNPLTKGSEFTDFCMKYTRHSELGYKRCVLSDKNAALRALKSGKPVVYVCHAGLADFASPIMLGDRLVGCFLGGQVRISSVIDKKVLEETAEELGIEYKSYYQAMKRINTVRKKDLEKSAKFLGIVAGVLSEMAYQNYVAIEKYRNLEKAARSQSHFLMSLSSELHENMSEWIAALEEIIRNGNVDSVMDVIDTMLANGSATYSIIGDIVDYMKCSDGNIALYESEYSIHDVIQAVEAATLEQASKRKITITHRIAEDVPGLLLGAGGRIEQILVKLVSGAVFLKEDICGESEIVICVSAKKDSYAHILNIEVYDKSMCLSTEEIEKMDDFFSGRRLLIKDRKDKNGFELSIVNLFVRQMYGKISVMSNETEGMRFIVELPQLEVSAN